ncbi:zinc ribbon domain-containing protein [Microbulbifer sp. SAOS-129_SWC]|uniref:zinc ribbon domain-containing protein n=1 Tax=Microbulbifer sp. SAOS-129_SWC TaxID=3145235 RepID=UPI00321704E1
MANSEFIGLVTCPHCGNENATVHEQQTGTKRGRRYYRCYTEINGNKMRCGTSQIIGPDGQAWLAANMRPVPGAEPAPAAPVPAEDQRGFVAEQQAEEGDPIGQPRPADPLRDGPPISVEPRETRPIGQTGKKSWLDALFAEDDDEA